MPDDCTALGAEAKPARRADDRPLQAEIGVYPAPIAGCGARKTHLRAVGRRPQSALDALGVRVFVPTPRNLHSGTGIESR